MKCLEDKQTPFEDIYSLFLDKITEDMYMEMTEEDTKKILESLLISSLIWFEFPRFELDNYSLDDKVFFSELTFEEKDIIASYMVVEWLGQQLASIENVRMKYSGQDFKFTSQANHMSKLQELKKQYTTEGFHKQRLYKRRKKDSKGIMRSTFDKIMEPLS